MTTPIWSWRPVVALVHITALIVTFPLVWLYTWWTLACTRSFSRSIETLTRWLTAPLEGWR